MSGPLQGAAARAGGAGGGGAAAEGARGAAQQRLVYAEPVPWRLRASAGVPLPRGALRRPAADAGGARASRREVLPGGMYLIVRLEQLFPGSDTT